MGNWEWGMGNGEWGMGNGEWGDSNLINIYSRLSKVRELFLSFITLHSEIGELVKHEMKY